MDVMDYGESWRWVHIDRQGILSKSVSCFARYEQCLASAKVHGFGREAKPTIVRRGGSLK